MKWEFNPASIVLIIIEIVELGPYKKRERRNICRQYGHNDFPARWILSIIRSAPLVDPFVSFLHEFVLDGVNGYLFPPGDADELTKILDELDRQPERLRKLDIPGPVPIISKEEHAKALLGIYRELR